MTAFRRRNEVRPGDLLWHLVAETLAEHPLWTDVRVGLTAGVSRRLVGKVRRTLPPVEGKRLARDGKADSPRGTAARAKPPKRTV